MTLAVALQAGPAQLARADASAAPPPITYGFGLSRNAPESWDPTTNTLVLDVSTANLAPDAGQPHTIRVILPTGYFDHPERRYPVFYLLHNMAASTSIVGAYVPQAYDDMILVLPYGGPRGWYVNWANQNTAAGAQNWENFEIDQVIPFVDANFRTVASSVDNADTANLQHMHWVSGISGLPHLSCSSPAPAAVRTARKVLTGHEGAGLLQPSGVRRARSARAARYSPPRRPIRLPARSRTSG
jgi:hypothetical protein